MSARRLFIYRMVAVIAIPALLFLALEVGLRMTGAGYSAAFTVASRTQGEATFRENESFAWQFFPRTIARAPFSFVLPAVKGERTYRIFVLGASAAQGDPEPAYGFSRILQVMLEHRFPVVNFEVVNSTITATNSHVVLRIAQDLARRGPDLFIVYLGNNEVVGPYGAGTVFARLTGSLGLIRAGIHLKATRTGQLMESLMGQIGGEEDVLKTWRGMEMFLDKQVRADDPGLKRVYQHFRKNLRDIIDVARRSGAKVVLSTVGVNLSDSAPFASLHRPDLTEGERAEWDALYREGIDLEARGEFRSAMERYMAAGRLDETFADLQYRMGRCSLALGEDGEARRRYGLAREFDTLRFRADMEINEMIRTAAESEAEGVYLVDAVRSFEEISPSSIPGNEFFYEHVHLKFKGNYSLARSIFMKVEEILPEWVIRGDRGDPLPSEEASKRRLAFTGYDQHRIAVDVLQRMAKPPFTNQLDHDQKLLRQQEEVARLAESTSPTTHGQVEAEYRRAIEKWDSDPWLRYNFAVFLASRRDHSGAADQLRLVIQHLPHYYRAYEKLAAALIQQRKFEEALVQCRRALEIEPDFYTARYTMAFAYVQLGRLDRAMDVYRELLSVDLAPKSDMYNELGRLLVQQRDFEAAVDAFQEGIRLNEDPEGGTLSDLHFNLGHSLKKLGKGTEARQALEKAAVGYSRELEGNPRSSAAHFALGGVFVEMRDFERAAEHFSEAVDLDPGDPANQLNLIKSLEARGLLDEAIEASGQAVIVMSELDQPSQAAQFEAYRGSLQKKRQQTSQGRR
jgi:tetratricopeptide (TPR) repeat protein